MEHLTLYQLNKAIQKTLDAQLSPSYWVVAEIGNISINHSGHCYLELVEKEDNSIIAKSRATIWAYTFRNLSLWFEKMTGQSLKQGLKILCNVNVQFHEVYGMSLNIKDIDANFTLGERARKRQEVINALQEQGVFDMNRELKLPPVIQHIAIISSPSAAGYEDFINQLQNNKYGYAHSLKLYRATMQGNTAAESIQQALMAIHDSAIQYDAVCIMRGGGSSLDLDCFDDFELANFVCQFPLPVITGIGHDRDLSVVDLVAHQSLKTPTAVAEWLISTTADFELGLQHLFERIAQEASTLIYQSETKLDKLAVALKTMAANKILTANQQLVVVSSQLKHVVKNSLARHKEALMLKEKTLYYLDPNTVLQRGYTLTTINGFNIVNQPLKQGDVIKTYAAKSTLTSKITQIDGKK